MLHQTPAWWQRAFVFTLLLSWHVRGCNCSCRPSPRTAVRLLMPHPPAQVRAGAAGGGRAVPHQPCQVRPNSMLRGTAACSHAAHAPPPAGPTWDTTRGGTTPGARQPPHGTYNCYQTFTLHVASLWPTHVQELRQAQGQRRQWSRRRPPPVTPPSRGRGVGPRAPWGPCAVGLGGPPQL